MPDTAKKKLIVICGPTAVGKTSLSIKLAKYFNTEILSADSRQFYSELKIGTAPPSKCELDEVKHHFIGSLSIKDYYNVAQFEIDGLRVLDEIFLNHDYAILVGGSGLYINALCNGIDELPDPDDSLRNSLKSDYNEKGLDFLKDRLFALDPEYYNKVDLSNPNRVIRAIEVCMKTGNSYTSLRTSTIKKRDFQIIKIGLNIERSILYNIINERVDRMFEAGLIEEAKNLYSLLGLNALKTVGYTELFDYFENKYSLEEAIEKIKTNSRRYAKRQLTWFRKDTSITWFHPENINEIIEYIHSYI
ncbi:MAG: tRNA (adenosine(37)-N6)-dimethylallyltransferase MiaA [Bacteroidota bacterium]|nr:tRNA (adenosine(37)-N6)-dimethylallyltransferase MiaA [Bacteroidota bacterium]